MDVQKVTTEYRLNYWSELIKECHNSGQTAASWCRDHNLNNKSYYYWLRKIRIAACKSIPDVKAKQQTMIPLKFTGEVRPVFAEIKIPSNESTQPAIILKRNDVVLEIQNGASSITIENTLKAIKIIC